MQELKEALEWTANNASTDNKAYSFKEETLDSDGRSEATLILYCNDKGIVKLNMVKIRSRQTASDLLTELYERMMLLIFSHSIESLTETFCKSECKV